MSGLDETLRQHSRRVYEQVKALLDAAGYPVPEGGYVAIVRMLLDEIRAGQPASIPPTTDTSPDPAPVDAERIRAAYAAYVEGWAESRALAREGTGATYAILAACRVADAVPAVLDELVALRADLDAAHDEIGSLRRDLDQQTTAMFANQAEVPDA